MSSTQRRKIERRPQYEDPTYLDLLGRLSANLRRLRDERGWTLEQAAERCQIESYQYLQAIEAKRQNATMTTLARLCKGFGVTMAELFGPAEKPYPQAGAVVPRAAEGPQASAGASPVARQVVVSGTLVLEIKGL